MPSLRLLVSTLLACVIAVPASASAENNPPREVRTAVGEMNPSPVAPSPIEPAPVEPSPATSKRPLPEAPSMRRVMDRKFIAVMSALGGAETFRLTTHKMVLDNEYSAGAPWVTSVPSGPHMFGKYGSIFTGELLVAYELKKPHDWLPGDKVIRKLWWAPPAALTVIHIKNGIRSMRTTGPGGCTSVDQCGGQ